MLHEGSVVVAKTRRRWLESRLYGQLQRFTDLVWLSVLWTVAALPLVTALPATAALLGVVRERARGREPALTRSFWRFFRENFRYALGLEIMAVAIGAGLFVNLQLAASLPPVLALLLQFLSGVAAMIIVSATAYAFPLMVGYRMPFGRLIKTSVLLAVGSLGTTAKCLGLLAGALLLTYLFPIAPLLIAGPVATALYGWVDRTVTRLQPTTEAATA